MAVLIGMSEEVRGKRFELDNLPFTLGRAPDNSIPLDTGSVSGHHCRIIEEDGHFAIEDLNSTNGTRINSRRIIHQALKHKNLLQVGAIEFLFEDEANADEADGAYLETDVEIDTAGAAAPQSFTNISPFNTRVRESKGAWYAMMVLLGAGALAGVGYFAWTLINTH